MAYGQAAEWEYEEEKVAQSAAHPDDTTAHPGWSDDGELDYAQEKVADDVGNAAEQPGWYDGEQEHNLHTETAEDHVENDTAQAATQPGWSDDDDERAHEQSNSAARATVGTASTSPIIVKPPTVIPFMSLLRLNGLVDEPSRRFDWFDIQMTEDWENLRQQRATGVVVAHDARTRQWGIMLTLPGRPKALRLEPKPTRDKAIGKSGWNRVSVVVTALHDVVDFSPSGGKYDQISEISYRGTVEQFFRTIYDNGQCHYECKPVDDGEPLRGWMLRQISLFHQEGIEVPFDRAEAKEAKKIIREWAPDGRGKGRVERGDFVLRVRFWSLVGYELRRVFGCED
ncbi:hypothetical protein B0H63DRAFT_562666 [Podospora didyma]|uniref:Uncharacterized protein n=1 Tax=Podospora didyma TaxID=330526 RepID=A0AAE0KEB6_9PEZI|nr:hypothetical protein B0H63DRAFT_562666 [Podospora didyma]